jgi:hypothetical protein
MARTRQPVGDPAIDGVDYITRKEGIELLDREARKYFNMSGEEFARKYRAGELEGPNHPHVDRVSMLIPLADP